MPYADKLPPIDTSTRYMPLRDAVCLIGRQYSDWDDDDVNQLATEREGSSDLEAWDRAAHAEEQLETWILGGILKAYDVNEYGRHQQIEERWLETPYFTICARTSRFLVFPDEWAPLAIDGPKLQQKLSGIVPSAPRKRLTYEWQPVVNKAWEIALEMEPPRTQATLIRQLDEWFMGLEGHENTKLGEKELKRVARDVIGYLGDRRLSEELSPPQTTPD